MVHHSVRIVECLPELPHREMTATSAQKNLNVKLLRVDCIVKVEQGFGKLFLQHLLEAKLVENFPVTVFPVQLENKKKLAFFFSKYKITRCSRIIPAADLRCPRSSSSAAWCPWIPWPPRPPCPCPRSIPASYRRPPSPDAASSETPVSSCLQTPSSIIENGIL